MIPVWHITPINDLEPHDETSEQKQICPGLDEWRFVGCKCKCHPDQKIMKNGAVILIHNSFDGREGVEWTNEILNQ